MATPYPTQSAATATVLWEQICAVAHGGLTAELIGQADSRWTLNGPADSESQRMADLFLPLLGPLPAGRPLVVAHLAQSLDGRIARTDGESHWITGPADLDHTHRLRAVCDAVLVGAETVVQDDCRLTVRRCTGPQPVRVVLDPTSRVPADRQVFCDGAAPTLWICGPEAPDCTAAGVRCVRLPVADGIFQISDLLDVLSAQGIRRVFVEGGGRTVAHMLQAGVLDRLHLAVAPMLMGEGRNTLGVALGANLSSCPRPKIRIHSIGEDWLFDCDFSESSQ
jgi:riboflavin-specific deaminase-like protein